MLHQLPTAPLLLLLPLQLGTQAINTHAYQVSKSQQASTMRKKTRTLWPRCTALCCATCCVRTLTFANPNAAFSNVLAYTAVSDSWETRARGSTRNAISRMLRYSCSSCCAATCNRVNRHEVEGRKSSCGT